MASEKITAVSVPLFSIHSKAQKREDYGKIESGFYFLNWLKNAGFNGWQMLPINETQLEKGSSEVHVPSPYKGYGVGIDPRYLGSAGVQERDSAKELKRFVGENRDWVEDYGFFCALRDYFGTDDWREWDEDLKNRKKDAIDGWSKKLKKEKDDHIFIQFLLHQEYGELKKKAKKMRITLIGDLPFYLTLKSPLVWAHQELFQIDKKSNMEFVSGMPETHSIHFGRQVWGHPLYRTDKKSKPKIIMFWKTRIKYLSKLFDSVRFDHAKGFFEYGAVDPYNPHNDKYKKGLGKDVFVEIVKYCKSLGFEVYAEDTGQSAQGLRKALHELDIPGIRIFRFALDEKTGRTVERYADVKNFPANTVVYTSTHDTVTLIGYLKMLNAGGKKQLAAAVGGEYSRDDSVLAASLRRKVIASKARIIIMPIQDLLLSAERINIPGTEKEVGDRNWRYKLQTPIEKLPTDLL